MKSDIQRLPAMITAAYPLCWLQTVEEQRARRAIASISRAASHDLYYWTCTEGLINVTADNVSEVPETKSALAVLKRIRDITKPSIFVLCDYRHYIKDPTIARTVRDLIRHLKECPSMILFVGPSLESPPELDHEITQVELPLPSLKELRKILNIFDSDSNPIIKNLGEEVVDELCKAARGLTSDEAETSFALAISEEDLTPDNIWRNKARVVSRDELTFIEDAVTADQIGGLDELKNWLKTRSKGFSDAAREYGLPTPKGVLIAGIPGTGKSLTAKAASSILGCPTLRLSLGACMRSLVGESEAALRGAIKRAESIAPCVLWIDEIEKAFAGMKGSGASDGGLFKRMSGDFLTWLQDHTSQVFVVATANDIASLPGELSRRGRFDQLFFVDLPDEDERAAIYQIHVQKKSRKNSMKLPEFKALAQLTNGFTGAEIEQTVIDGMFISFADGGRKLEPSDIIEAIHKTVPSSETYKTQIDELKAWAKGRALMANTPKKGQEPVRTITKRKVPN